MTTIESYNPTTNRWSSYSPMSTARDGLSNATVGDLIFAFEGWGGSTTTEIFDTTTGR